MAKKDPFAADDVESEKVADRAATETLKEKVKEKREAATGDGELEIDVERAEDELEDLPPPQRESRQARRANRYREVQEERDTLRREREEMAEKLSRMEQMLQSQQRPQGPPQPDKDPLEEKMQKLYEEQELMYQSYQARQQNMTPEEVNQFKQKAWNLQREMMRTESKLAARESQPSEEAIRQQVLREQLMREHGDVLSDQRQRDFFQGVWMQMRAKGRPDDWNTLNEAADRTRREFGRQPKNAPPPSDSYKRKLSGVPRGGGSSEGGGGTVVTMNAHHKRMADAAFQHIKDEGERYKRWAAGPGKRLLGRDKAG